MNHRALLRPVAAVVVTVPGVVGLAAGTALAAGWSGWAPLPDRYQGAVEYRVRVTGKKDDPGYEIQFRNRYDQKVTLKLVVLGADASGTPQQFAETVALDAGDRKRGGKPTDPIDVAVPTLTTINVADVQFAGTPPAPTAAGKPTLTAKQIDDLISAAQKSAAAHDWTQASVALKTILDGSGSLLQDGQRAQVETNLGVALYNQKNSVGAEAAFREAARLAPNEAIYQSNLGTVLMNERKYADAVTAFQEAVRLAPQNADYQAHLKAAQQAVPKT